MDEILQIEFLDLTDIDESELNHLQQLLCTVSPSVKLPWEVHTEYEYGNTPYATEAPNGPELVPALECDPGGMVPAQHHHMAPEAVYPEVPVISVPPPVSVPPSAQPVITTIYNMIPAMPLSNVYVGNVTANVNVQSYVGTHLTSYPQQPQLFRTPAEAEMTSPNASRNGSRRGRGGKGGSKRTHDVVIDSPPTSAPLQAQNYHIYQVPPPLSYHQQTFYTSAAQAHHPSAQHATGPPLYLQNIYPPHPQPIYSTFPPPLYSSAPLPVPATESSPIVAAYTVEDIEEKEVEVVQYENEVIEEDLKTSQNVETESCNVVGTVVVNNSSILEFTSDNSVVTFEEDRSEPVITEDNSDVEVKQDSVPQQEKHVPSSPFSCPRKHQPSTPTEPPSQAPLDKSWASLFNKNGSVNSPSLFDGARIPSGQKPVATVPPFPNSTPPSDTARKAAETETSKHFPPLTPGQSPASAMMDDPNLHRLGEFLSKYQLDHKAISLQPRGLTNRSSWCYINSTLQALLACPPFYNLMKSLPLPSRRSGKSSTPIIDSMCQFVNEFVPLSATSRVNRKEKAQRKDENFEVVAGAAFEPSYIYKMLSNIQSDTFKVEGRQEDAEEFLSCLLNAINDEMLELIKLVEDPSSKSTLSNGDITNGDAASQSQDEDEDGWKVMGPKNKGSITRRADFGRTPVSDIFRGELRSRVHRAGDESTDSVQPFFTLQLDIEKAQSVKDALELLVGRDQLEGVTCSKTNQEVEAWQQVTLQELPLVLILHLKWFDYKLDGCSKIVKTVDFPIDLSVDSKLMSSTKNYNRNQKKYKLFAVVYHDGKEATKGHYITDVYHVGYGGWVRYDDSVVKAVQEASMLHPRGSRVPYLLYYRRCDTIGSGAVTPDKGR